MNKEEMLAFLQANPRSYLATIENGAPRVRAMGLFRIGADGIIIQTWKDKDVGLQMVANPEVELCFNGEGKQVRVRGKVSLLEDAAMKEQVLVERPGLKKFYDEGHEIALFLLKNGVAFEWTGEKNFAPKEYVQL